MGVELHVRYRAGRDGTRITFPDGSVVQLAPFAPFRFETFPARIEGTLTRTRRTAVQRETKRRLPDATLPNPSEGLKTGTPVR